jgi:hypothetical protein
MLDKLGSLAVVVAFAGPPLFIVLPGQSLR